MGKNTHEIKKARVLSCPLTGEYHALTRWKDHGGGRFEVVSEASRYDVTADVVAIKRATINGIMDALAASTDDASDLAWIASNRKKFLEQADGASRAAHAASTATATVTTTGEG